MRNMTQEEQARLINEKLVEYSQCLKTVHCVVQSLKDKGEKLRKLGSKLLDNPLSIVPPDGEDDKFYVRDANEDGTNVYLKPKAIAQLLRDLKEVTQKRKELEAFLVRTEHAHMIQR